MPNVIVGCKLPHGLELKIPGAKPVVLNGVNSSNIVGGHGLTEVDKEFFEKWLAIYKEYAPVKRGLIFAQDKPAAAEAEAKEKVDNVSGFEGLNPDKPAPGIVPENYEGMKK